MKKFNKNVLLSKGFAILVKKELKLTYSGYYFFCLVCISLIFSVNGNIFYKKIYDYNKL